MKEFGTNYISYPYHGHIFFETDEHPAATIHCSETRRHVIKYRNGAWEVELYEEPPDGAVGGFVVTGFDMERKTMTIAAVRP